MDLFPLYKLYLEREKQIYVTFNKMKIDDGPLVLGFCWIPARNHKHCMNVMRELKESNPVNLDMPRLVKLHPRDYMDISPPTLFLTNEFTEVYQMITDQYDVPRYKEINPSLFACVTFPFLFGMMFGDACHGTVLFVIGCLLCLAHYKLIESQGKNVKESPLAGFFMIRYLCVLLGFFSAYCGFMYNDFASIPLGYSTCYDEEAV